MTQKGLPTAGAPQNTIKMVLVMAGNNSKLQYLPLPLTPLPYQSNRFPL